MATRYNNDPPLEPRALLNEAQLRERAEVWKKRLRLQDWNTEISVARQSEMRKPTSVGQCRSILTLKHANILLLDPDDRKLGEGPVDMEADLVHELLHLHFDPLQVEAGSAEDIAQEQAIELIAQALVALDR